jgi:hypothetical protein
VLLDTGKFMSIKTWAKWSVALAAVVAFQACGGGSDDICDRLEDLSDTTGSCFSTGDTDTDTDTDAEDTSCDEAFANCTDEDKEAYNKFLDCAEDVGECKQGEEQSWAVQVAACAEGLEVSDACGDVTGAE